MLDDISAVRPPLPFPFASVPSADSPDSPRQVKTWSKVNSGMIKMYRAEVLGKLPVVQHFLFGTLLPYPTPEGEEELDDGAGEVDAHGHVHAESGTGWTMDCCGIPGESGAGCGPCDIHIE